MQEFRTRSEHIIHRKAMKFCIETILEKNFELRKNYFFRVRKKKSEKFSRFFFVMEFFENPKISIFENSDFWEKKTFFFKISKNFRKNIFLSFSNCSKKFSKKPISIIFDFLETYAPDTFIFSLFVTTRQDWGTLRHPYIWWFFGKSGFGGLHHSSRSLCRCVPPCTLESVTKYLFFLITFLFLSLNPFPHFSHKLGTHTELMLKELDQYLASEKSYWFLKSTSHRDFWKLYPPKP